MASLCWPQPASKHTNEELGEDLVRPVSELLNHFQVNTKQALNELQIAAVSLLIFMMCYTHHVSSHYVCELLVWSIFSLNQQTDYA